MTETTSRFASITVGNFLKEASGGRRMWFLAQGEPQALVGSFMTKDGFETRIFPGLRGVRVGDAVSTAQEAEAEAARVRADLLGRDDLEAFDEAEAGVDDEATDIAARFQESGARLDRIIHVGAMAPDDGCEDLRTLIEDLDPAYPDLLFKDIPWLAGFLRPEQKAGADMSEAHEDRGDDEDGEEDEPERRSVDELVDDFLMTAHDHGTMGFVVEVSVPKYVPHKDGAGCSIHMGTRYLQHRYASTFRVACDRALEWAEARIGEMRKVMPEEQAA